MMTPDELRAYNTAYRRAWRATHPERAKAAVARWQAANPEKKRAGMQRWGAEHREERKAKNAVYRTENAARIRAQRARWRATHRDVIQARSAAWYAEHRDACLRNNRVQKHRRRANQASVLLTVQVTADHCGVCLGPLMPDLSHPHPLSTTVGHEPPLSVAVRDGWRLVAERPEHWSCNAWKNARDDASLVGKGAPPSTSC